MYRLIGICLKLESSIVQKKYFGYTIAVYKKVCTFAATLSECGARR